MRKFFASERFDVNRCGPRNESYPMLPSVPAAGRANDPPVAPLVASTGIGVNQVRKPLESLLAPRENEPDARSGRQMLTYSSALHSFILCAILRAWVPRQTSSPVSNGGQSPSADNGVHQSVGVAHVPLAFAEW